MPMATAPSVLAFFFFFFQTLLKGLVSTKWLESERQRRKDLISLLLELDNDPKQRRSLPFLFASRRILTLRFLFILKKRKKKKKKLTGNRERLGPLSWLYQTQHGFFSFFSQRHTVVFSFSFSF